MGEAMQYVFGAESAGQVLGVVLDLSIKTLLILALAGIVTSLARRQSAAFRHTVWLAAMGAVLIMPLLTAALPSWRVLPSQVAYVKSLAPVVPQAPPAKLPPLPAIDDSSSKAGEEVSTPPPVSPLRTDVSSEVEASDPTAAPSGQTSASAATVATQGQGVSSAVRSSGPENVVLAALSNVGRQIVSTPWTVLLLLTWLAGVLAVLAHYLTGAAGLWFLARRSSPITTPEWTDLADEIGDRLWITRPIRLLRSASTTMPVTWGGLRPAVLLPHDADSWSADRKRFVLTHEMAHIKRWDCTTQGMAQLVCALHWFNPLVWTAARQLRVERERACDDQVLVGGGAASSYAEHLLDIARSLKATLASPFAAVAMARPSQLEGRVLAILDPSRRRQPVSSTSSRAVLGLALVVALPIATMAPESAGTAVPEDGSQTRGSVAAVPPATGLPLSLDGMSPESGSDLARKEPAANAANAAGAHSAPLSYSRSLSAADTIDGRKAQVVNAFIAALNDEDDDIRAHAARMLGEMEDERAIPALRTVLEEDASERVRRAALYALSEMGVPEVMPTLIRLADTSQDPYVRRQVAWMLGENASRNDQAAVAALGRLLKDPSPEVRSHAAWALGELESDESARALGEALQDESAEVRRKAAWALAEIGNPAAVSALTGALNDSDREVRKFVAYALAEIDTDDSNRALARLAEDPDPDVRKQAIYALADSDDPAATKTLIAAIADKNLEIRKAAIMALADSDDPAATDPLIKALGDSSPEVRRFAAYGLAERADDNRTARVVRALVDVLKSDSDADVRRAAVHALGEIGSPDSFDAIRDATKDKDADVRKAAIYALGEIDWEDESDDKMGRSGNWDMEVHLSSPDVHVRTGVTGLGVALGSLVGSATEFALTSASEAIRAVDVESIVASIGQSIEEAELDRVMAEVASDLSRAEMEVRDEVNQALVESLVCIIENDPGSSEARQARRALERMKSPIARKELKRLDGR